MPDRGRFRRDAIKERRLRAYPHMRGVRPTPITPVTVMRARPQALPPEHSALFDPGQASRAIPWHRDMSFLDRRDESAFQKTRFRSPS